MFVARAPKNKPEPEQEEKRPLSVRIAHVLDIPQDTIGNLSHIEIAGNTRVLIEGCKGILEYETDRIRISTGKMMVKFTGRNLSLRCMNGENAEIEGFFTSIEFSL